MNNWQVQKEYEERIDLKNQLNRIKCGADANYLHKLDFKKKLSVIDELYSICDKQNTIKTTKLREYLDRLNHD